MVSSNDLSSTSTTTNYFISTQQIPEEATKQKKLPKSRIGYMELDSFATADTKKSYFCYNCTYFIKPNHCMLVTDEGMDINGQTSGNIAPHGICYLWMPFEKDIE